MMTDFLSITKFCDALSLDNGGDPGDYFDDIFAVMSQETLEEVELNLSKLTPAELQQFAMGDQDEAYHVLVPARWTEDFYERFTAHISENF